MPYSEKPRLRQLRRVLLIVELLAPLRYGATISQICEDVSAELGEVCQRTIERDLRCLRTLGIVKRSEERYSQAGNGNPYRWIYCDQSIRSTIHRRTAEILTERELIA